MTVLSPLYKEYAELLLLFHRMMLKNVIIEIRRGTVDGQKDYHIKSASRRISVFEYSSFVRRIFCAETSEWFIRVRYP